MKNRKEPSTVSTRPTQMELPFGEELSFKEPVSCAEEPRGQSCSAVVEKPVLSEPEPPSEANAIPREKASSAVQQDLMKLIVAPANLDSAWQQVKSNGGSAGPDGMTIAEFPNWCREHWPTIRQQLLDRTYRPQPVRRVAIPKPDGGQRLLGIPNVLDRVIQQAIAQVLTPILDLEFSESSFGFRPNRSDHGAAKQVQRTIRSGYRWVVDIDLSKFFDTVNHDILMSRVARKVSDKGVLKLIGRYVRAGVMVDGIPQPTDKSTPQGGPLSPLLSNILLDDLDKELERRDLPFARYADDALILVRSSYAAWKVMASVSRFLTRKLKLIVNEKKSAVRRSDETEFLGFEFHSRKANLRVTAKNLQRLKDRVREITSRKRGRSFLFIVGEFSRYLRGWMGYFGLSSTKRIWSPLDGWIRRRVRMYLWKQWRLPRTRIRKLVELGVDKKTAKTHGASRKGYWRLSGRSKAHECRPLLAHPRLIAGCRRPSGLIQQSRSVS